MQIKFDHVSYTYQEKSPFASEAVKDVSLEIKEGSFTCIVGHTGCGKSTLIQQLNGLLIPTSGNVYVGDYVVSRNRKIRTKKLHNLRKDIGVVFQFSEYQLFENTVEEDVAFGPTNFGISKEEAIKIAHEKLELVGIKESYYKNSPFELSGGERRRVAIAGILAMNPKVLILDEPTAGLDPHGSKEILELFKKLNESGTTIVLVTHDMNIVLEYATDVIVMNDGHVLMNTTPDKLFVEDVEKYSLETPILAKFIQLLLEKNIKINLSSIHTLEDVVREIGSGKK